VWWFRAKSNHTAYFVNALHLRKGFTFTPSGELVIVNKGYGMAYALVNVLCRARQRFQVDVEVSVTEFERAPDDILTHPTFHKKNN
jgi:hypothetical protein